MVDVGYKAQRLGNELLKARREGADGEAAAADDRQAAGHASR